MNDRDMILMTIRISRSLLDFSFPFGLSQLRYLYIFFEVVFFRFSFPLGFVVAFCLYIPWTIGSCLIPYTYIAALLSDYCNFYRVCFLYYGFSRP
jgi:hypothetical protein